MEKVSYLSIKPAPHEAVEEISRMTNLNSLFIWDMEDKDINVFSELKNMYYLYLDGCGLTSLDGIEAFPNLSYLYIRYNYIEDLSPLSQSKDLKYLAVTDNPVRDWSFLSDLDMLDSIDCSEDQYPEIIRELGGREENINITITVE